MNIEISFPFTVTLRFKMFVIVVVGSTVQDTVIFERLACTSLFTQSTMDHLENFAKTGNLFCSCFTR